MLPNEDFSSLEENIGYEFQDKKLLLQALTHSSFSNEQKINKHPNYERLEFLGDAVLELVSSEFLYKEYKDMPEGELTKLRASLVCEPALAFDARGFGLQEHLLMGKGEEQTGGRERDSIVSDACEALIGAIFLDGGFEAAKAFILKFVLNDAENKKLFYDSKTILQEVVQGNYKESLHYELISEEGPDHDKQFSVEARIGDKVIGAGTGHTKKAAEQEAAYQALLVLKPKL